MYFSQYKQDEFVDEYFQRKQDGVFLDIAAHDGKFLSNSFFSKWKEKDKIIFVISQIS